MSICVITGCNSGIGKASAIELAHKGYEVVMLVRDSDRSRKALHEIRKKGDSEKVSIIYVDLSSLESIKNAADEIRAEHSKIDVLINNAGVFKTEFQESKDAFEMSVAVNYIAPFALTNQLLPLLGRAESPRVINVTSHMYRMGKIVPDKMFSKLDFNGAKAYANSKLMLMHFTQELSRRLKKDNIAVASVHPGAVGSDVFREYPKWINRLMGLFLSKPEDGAKGTIQLALEKDTGKINGRYFFKLKPKATHDISADPELSKSIFSNTEEITGIKY